MEKRVTRARAEYAKKERILSDLYRDLACLRIKACYADFRDRVNRLATWDGLRFIKFRL
jgi:hypothetical protein